MLQSDKKNGDRKMPIKIGDVVWVTDQEPSQIKDWKKDAFARVGVVVGEPAAVIYEGYPIEVLIDGEIYRVHRENILPLDIDDVELAWTKKCND